MNLTTITAPFGLLDEVYGPGTQEALKAHGGPYEMLTQHALDDVEWITWDRPGFTAICVYRVKPAPPKPREWWANQSAGTFVTYHPNDNAEHYEAHGFIHVREVITE